MKLTRRRALTTAAAAPLALALPAISSPVFAGVDVARNAADASAIMPPTAEAWVAAYNLACRQALQDIVVYGRSALCIPEDGGLPYAVHPFSMLAAEPA